MLSRDGTSMEDELTQYTLTPTVTGDSSAAKDKVKTNSNEMYKLRLLKFFCNIACLQHTLFDSEFSYLERESI